MTIETHPTQPEETQSDYEKEWALDSDLPQETPVAHTEEIQKTDTEGPAPEASAQDVTQESAETETTSPTAESGGDDIFAGATEAQLAAYRKAENDAKAMKGRHRLSQDKAIHLERQLSELQRQNAELTEQARKPTQFEIDHPEYAEDIRSLTGDVHASTSSAETDPAELILQAHPDAGEVYNSPEFSAWISEQPSDTVSIIQGSDPNAINNILSAYKTHASEVSSSQRQARLNATSDTGGTQATPDLRRASELSVQEQYAREWENED